MRGFITILLTIMMTAINAQTGMKQEEIGMVDFTIWPKGELNSVYACYFTGNSYLADMVVTF